MKEKFYHPELDRLRFVAFLAVFLHHYLPHDVSDYKKLGGLAAHVCTSFTLAGALGVDLFFCLSSFLITTLLIREADSRGTIDVRAFWIRRILRIWPLYYFFIAFTALIVPLLLPHDKFGTSYVLGFGLLSGNWVCVANGYPPSVAAPLWSVSIEEQFYLAWPLLLSIVSIRRLPVFALICLFVASATRLFVALLHLPYLSVWCNTFARLDPIALGALFAVFNHNTAWVIGTRTRLLLLSLSVLLPPALLFALGDSCFSGVPSLLFYPVAAVCCLFILVAFYNNGDNGSREDGRSPVRAWCSRALVYLGRISYGLYVFHVLGIALAANVDVSKTAPLLYKAAAFAGRCCLSFGLTVAFASASYFLLEKPFLRLKERFTYVKSTPADPEKGSALERAGSTPESACSAPPSMP
jgi:peptidoglycan/LPS O-acetylase OafA/YrhL